MKSTLKFDIDGAGQPIVRFNISHESDDLRDKVASNWLSGLGYESNYLLIVFDEKQEYGSSRGSIIPFPSLENLKSELEEKMKETTVDAYDYAGNPITLTVRPANGSKNEEQANG